MSVVRGRAELRAAVAGWRREGLRIGLVPTMGALHAGHLALMAAAKKANDRVVVTIFVNPKQFNSAADLGAYPRTEEDDLARLAAVGVDLVYLPEAGEVYPPGFATNVQVLGLSEDLCGSFRPGHFEGMATIVTKLFLQTAADQAYFGEKDYQQLLIVRQLTRDLDIPLDVIGLPTVREPDGLAMSSRNARLSRQQREVAAALPQALWKAAAAIRSGGDRAGAVLEGRRRVLEAGFREVEYFELRAARNLRPLAQLTEPGRLLAAAWLGDTRLIDNVPVDPR